MLQILYSSCNESSNYVTSEYEYVDWWCYEWFSVYEQILENNQVQCEYVAMGCMVVSTRMTAIWRWTIKQMFQTCKTIKIIDLHIVSGVWVCFFDFPTPQLLHVLFCRWRLFFKHQWWPRHQPFEVMLKGDISHSLSWNWEPAVWRYSSCCFGKTASYRWLVWVCLR